MVIEDKPFIVVLYSIIVVSDYSITNHRFSISVALYKKWTWHFNDCLMSFFISCFCLPPFCNGSLVVLASYSLLKGHKMFLLDWDTETCICSIADYNCMSRASKILCWIYQLCIELVQQWFRILCQVYHRLLLHGDINTMTKLTMADIGHPVNALWFTCSKRYWLSCLCPLV